MPRRSRYTEAEIAYLRMAWPVLTMLEVLDEFCIRFGKIRTRSQIKSTLANHKISRPSRRPRAKCSFLYTDEQLAFIAEKYKQHHLREVVTLLNKQFGTSYTFEQIKGCSNNHKILAGRTGCFSKGSVPWNAGTKGVMKPNRGNFTAGHVPANIKPFGYERICSKDGCILVKVDEINPYTGFRGRFRYKHIVTWEQHNGPVPVGHVIRFIDGDQLNCDITNLECVTKAMHLQLNRQGYSKVAPELKPLIRTVAQIALQRGIRARQLNPTQNDR